MPCRSVSQEVLNQGVEGLPVRKHTAGRPVERAQSQGDSVISGGSLQDRDSDFDRSPVARPRPQMLKSKYSRKFSDPQPLSFPVHVSSNFCNYFEHEMRDFFFSEFRLSVRRKTSRNESNCSSQSQQ